MALKVVTKKKFIKQVEKITKYLKVEFGKKAATDFYNLVNDKIDLLIEQPNIGTQTAIIDVKTVLVGKGKQNKMYYKVDKGSLVIIDIKDSRMNPKRNRFYKR